MLKYIPNNFNENGKKLSFEKKYCYERKVIKKVYGKDCEVTEIRTKNGVNNILGFGDKYIENLQKFATK